MKPQDHRVYHDPRQFPSSRRKRARTRTGSQIAEFAPALMILVGVVLVPLLDLMIVPVRWMLAQELANDYARRLAMCETFKQSQALMEADPSLATRLAQLGGVKAESISLHLRISRIGSGAVSEDAVVVDQPGKIPPAWLPNGAKAPCAYYLELDIQSQLSPAILVSIPGISVSGLTQPIPTMIRSSHEWSNLAMNPNTQMFFVNE